MTSPTKHSEMEVEWLEAQKIVISENLVEVAKKQLKFLTVVDRHRCLSDDPVLHRAIFRYETYWIPLLAKHTESDITEGPLVVPLDCEWIWHCHRLNPLRYKSDCEETYGRILDNKNVISTIEGSSKTHTEEIWKMLYPEEPYELDLSCPLSEDSKSEEYMGARESTKYDLVAAVKRQSPFFYQVSRPSMNDAVFLEGAVARYKGFLHLIKRNKERSIRRFCVPTYDIDLIWHSHQLNPVSYCKDLVEALDKVLEHDDTDSNRTKGQKLDVGFSGTTKQWEETFGSRYWKAGAMYRGPAPSPVTSTPWKGNSVSKSPITSSKSQKIIQLSKKKVVEVFLEIVGVRNLPEGHKGNLFVMFSKKTDLFFNSRRRLSILSESREKQVASFQCEPTGELFLELMSQTPSSLPISRPAKTMGTTSVPLHYMLEPSSKLSVERWFKLVSSSGALHSKPICLRIAVSVSPPVPAPRVLQMVRSHPFLKKSCFFPLPGSIQPAKNWTRIIDEDGKEIISIQMRDSKKALTKNVNLKEIIGIVGWSGETHVLAELVETGWHLIDSNWSPRLQKKCGEDGHIFELSGNRVVRLYPGRKLEYEPKSSERHKSERDFITAIEFSTEDPYGKAVALLNIKSGFLKVKEEWFVASGITLSFILFDTWRKEGYGVFIPNGENSKADDLMEDTYGCDGEVRSKQDAILAKDVTVAEEDSTIVPEKKVDKEKHGDAMNGACLECSGCRNMVNGGGCGSGCSGVCGNLVKSGGCGSECGGGCGNMVSSGGCGSGCGGGGGCGNMAKSGGCGGGCGSGCGNMVESGGCGGGCGSGCGDMVKSGGCGGCGGCGGSCGNSIASEMHVTEVLVGSGA